MTLQAPGAFWSDNHLALYVGNCLHMDAIPDNSVHCVVTSPPYLSKRKYKTEPLDWPDGWRGHLGLEPSPELFIAHLIEIFREVKRVLRDDGTCWVNLGDTHSAGSRKTNKPDSTHLGDAHDLPCDSRVGCDLPDGDLIGIPWRFALAMQADGWHLHQDIIWHKPAPMPESVNGVRWERHRVKVNPAVDDWRVEGRKRGGLVEDANNHVSGGNTGFRNSPEWADCPGCPECAPNDGLVLRRGSWRPTASHEYIFMFSKGPHYYADREAVKERKVESTLQDPRTNDNGHRRERGYPGSQSNGGTNLGGSDAARNLRSVWKIGPEPFSGAHFATFPSELPTICIKASTSESGVCPKCGAQWARVVKTGSSNHDGETESAYEVGSTANRLAKLRQAARDHGEEYQNETETIGWRAICSCNAGEPIPATVLDPFAGTFTTGLAAKHLGRRAIGYELSEAYAQLAIDRNRQGGLL